MNRKTFFITTILLTLFIVMPLCGMSFDIFGYDYSDATDYYPMACDVFEVSKIKNGSFEKVSCHNDFAEAKKAMKTSNDYVVRYVNSKSPSKIVAMNSGVVSIYPGRTKDELAYIYQNMDERNSYWKSTYCGEHTEAFYLDTPTMESSYYPYGAVKINLRGFEGYMSILNADLIPTQFIENEWKMWLGGENQAYKEYPYDAIPGQDYYMIVQDGNYQSMQYTYYYTYSKKSSLFTEHKYMIDNAANYLAAGMKANVKYYSADGINYFSDRNLTKKVATVYNYYRFLPLRSKTNISASTFDNYLKKKVGSEESTLKGEGNTFIKCQDKYGANALLVYSMACHESAYGKSFYAGDRYNLFGWGAYDSNPGNAATYASIEECVKQHMGENLRYYMDYDHSYYYGTCLGNKGTGFNVLYASDADWAAKICSFAYEIDKYDNGNNGKLTDYNKYTVGVVNDFDPNIYKTANGNDVLYTGRFGRNYQKDLTVIILGKEGNRYKIQSTNNVVNGSRLHQSGCYEYDWNKSVGYIDTKFVTVLTTGEIPDIGPAEIPHEPFASVRDIKIKDGNLTISGIGGITGVNFTKGSSNIKHEVVFYDMENAKNIYKLDANNVTVSNFSLHDGYDYSDVGFELNLDLTKGSIPIGSYSISIITTNGNETFEKVLESSLDDFSSIVYSNGDNCYRITSNYLYDYRIELDIYKTKINYACINKPTTRTSLVSFDSIDFDDEGNLNINGHGMIYYLNYDKLNNIKYDVYLVKEDGTTLTMNTEHIENRFDYQRQFKSSYNMDNISFKSSINTKDLKGKYNIILGIKNGDYIDYVEFVNPALMDLPSTTLGDKNIKLLTSNIRDRIYLTAGN